MSTFEDVLAGCLADIEAGKMTIEDCLTRHPGEAEALEPLLRTAAALGTMPAVEPSPSFSQAAPARLLNLIASRKSIAHAPGRPAPTARPAWPRRVARLALPVLAASLLLAGTSYASRSSLPGSPLYPLKRAVEVVQVAATPNDELRAQAVLSVSDNRVNEVALLAGRDGPGKARQASASYTRLLGEAQALVDRVPPNQAKSQKMLAYMRERLLAQQNTLQTLLTTAPELQRPFIRANLQDNQRLLGTIDARMPRK